MAEAIWIDREEQLADLAAPIETARRVGVDTEFMRERTFFPKLCLLQLCADGRIWCIDTLKISDLAPLTAALFDPRSEKILHAARQDLEALYLATRRVLGPVFDTQIAAGCIGMKPQLGYADLARAVLGVSITKSQTRTDWSRRPLSAAQLAYAAEDVEHLPEIAARLKSRLNELGRESWVTEDCSQLANSDLYDPDPARAWTRLKGIAQLPRLAAGIAVSVARWRERLARERDAPRTWILSDAAIFTIAQSAPQTRERMVGLSPEIAALPAAHASTLWEAIAAGGSEEIGAAADGILPEQRPTPQQKALISRLAGIVDQRAAELGVSAEILATRGEIKALALGRRDSQALKGWRSAQIGERLLTELARDPPAEA